MARDKQHKRQRTLLVVTQLEMGGAQSIALQLAAGLRERGHDAQTWFLYRKHDAYKHEPCTDVISESKPRTPLGLWRLRTTLIRKMKVFAPDSVIGFTYYANAIALGAAKSIGVPTRIATQHNPAWAYPMIGRTLDRHAGSTGTYTANVAVSSAVSQTFDRHPNSYRSQLQVIPNGITALSPNKSRAETRRAFKLPANAPLGLAVGRLVTQKNHTALVRALARCNDAHIVIAGDGELRDNILSLATDTGVTTRLHLLGEVSRQDVRNLMGAADFFVMPSIHEGMSLTLLEALDAGLPIVASSIPAQSEVLAPKGTDPVGIMHDADDHTALADAINRLSADPVLREMYASRSRKRSEDFSIASMVDCYESVLLRSR